MVGAGLPALGWTATKPAGRTPGKRGQARAYAFQRREDQPGNLMVSGRVIRAHPAPGGNL